MNFFFSFCTENYSTLATIPKFKNYTKSAKNINLYEIIISDNLWKVSRVKCDEDKNFFYYNTDFGKKSFHMLFLSKENNLNSNYIKIREELIPIDNYSKTFPDFRCNLKIKNKIGGFSSYQSEYPFEMIEKNGIIVSQANILLNFTADINKIFFVNIYKQPIKKAFNAFLINKRLEKIISKYVFYTNELNEINIDINKDFFEEDVYLITENYLGIPIFLSEKNGQISFEHTHPMHEFLIHKNRHNDTKKIKNEFIKILKKNFS